MSNETARAEAIAGLRMFADWCEATPDFPAEKIGNTQILIFCKTLDQFRANAKILGRGEKGAEGNYFMFTRQFGPVRVQAYIEREQICERIVTQVEKPAITVPAEPERHYPARVEEVVTYKCPESIFDADRRKEEAVNA